MSCIWSALIHQVTRSAFPGERLWTAAHLGEERTIRSMRIRNREGCDVYIQTYAENRNASYLVLDLDNGDPIALSSRQIDYAQRPKLHVLGANTAAPADRAAGEHPLVQRLHLTSETQVSSFQEATV